MTQAVKDPSAVFVMSVYNAEDTLEACLDSLLAQTYQNWLAFIADDGSQDGSADILQHYASKDQRFDIQIHANNTGMADRLNRLIAKALKQFPRAMIARMDGDDICFPDRLEKQLSYLGDHPEIGVLSCFAEQIDQKSSLTGKHVETATMHDQIAVNSFFSAPILHPGAVMRPEMLRKVGPGPYNPAYKRAQDFALWSALAHQTHFAVLDEPLLYYRIGALKKEDKESALNIYRRAILKRNLSYLDIEEHDPLWMSAFYALAGVPLPDRQHYSGNIADVADALKTANRDKRLYAPALFERKIDKMAQKAQKNRGFWKNLLKKFE